MFRVTVMTSALAFAIALPAHADKSSVKPGEWSYSMKTEIPGMPFAMPAMTFKHCVTQEDADKGEAYRNSKEQQGDCKTENLQQGKGTASYDVVCTGRHPTTGHYDITFDDNSMKSTGTMHMEGQDMKQTMEAKRLGDCKN